MTPLLNGVHRAVVVAAILFTRVRTTLRARARSLAHVGLSRKEASVSLPATTKDIAFKRRTAAIPN